MTHPIDAALSAAMHGDFALGEMLNHQALDLPVDDMTAAVNRIRALYNLGQYHLRAGDLQAGMALVEKGRPINIFGNQERLSQQPDWEGQTNTTVLLIAECGLGDQIHGARYITEIAAMGNKVIVACDTSLAQIFSTIEGCSAAIGHAAIHYTFHNYVAHSMSVIRKFGYGYDKVSGKAYIPSDDRPQNAKPKIALRWSGNPRFEHEQHRHFPTDLLFNAVKDIDADFISLQRDQDTDKRPEWVAEVPLSNWIETQQAIASCDLVITSCTSTAHMAGAMGVPTWIITPIMPYYLWAPPTDKTVWYDSVELFRQEVYGDWQAPFDKIKLALAERFTK